MRVKSKQKKTSVLKLVLSGIFCLGILTLFISPAAAQFNQEINYQGRLLNSLGESVADGDYEMVFKLYTQNTGGVAIWTESYTGGDKVPVLGGLFSVMLGSLVPLNSLDFDQTLYLGVDIEGDGEMVPRKILGAVPAAFKANDANTVGGVASTSLLRNDLEGGVTATSTNTLFSLVQKGSGKIAEFFSGLTSVFTILNNGNVGIGTDTPTEKLHVNGNLFATGAILDSLGNVGTSGQVLSSTVTGTEWITLAGGGGSSLWSQSGANIFFNTGNVAIGTSTPSEKLTIAGNLALASSSDKIYIGGTQMMYLPDQTQFAGSLFIGDGGRNPLGAGYHNMGIGLGALASIDSDYIGAHYASDNTAIGYNALHSLEDGYNNTAVGIGALASSTWSYNTVAIGENAMRAGDFDSVAVGNYALGDNEGGGENVAVGNGALEKGISAGGSVAVGNSALEDYDGFGSVGIGRQAMSANINGLYNVAIGDRAGVRYGPSGLYLTRADESIYLGALTRAGANNVTNEIVIGDSAVGNGSNSVTLGNDSITKTILKGNIGLGTTTPTEKLTVAGNLRLTGALKDSANAAGTAGQVLTSTGTGTEWVTLAGGGGASLWSQTGSNIHYTAGNVGIGTTTPSERLTIAGNLALASSSDKIYIAGTQMMYLPDQTAFTGSLFIGDGGQKLSRVSGTDGRYNTGIGIGALASTTTGNANTALGSDALYYNTTGYFNTAVGSDALYYNTTGRSNDAFGFQALVSNITGSNNTALGSYSLLLNETGDSNVAVGYEALMYQEVGSHNVAIGRESLTGLMSGGSYNIGIGRTAGRDTATYGDWGNDNASSSIYLGAYTRASAGGNENEIVIGNHALGNGSHSVTLGNDLITKTILKGNIGIGTTTPSEKLTIAGNLALASSSDKIYIAGTQMMYLPDQTVFPGSMFIGNGGGNLSITDPVLDGRDNTAVGIGALTSVTRGRENTAIGAGSLAANTSGFANTAIGRQALNSNTTGRHSVAIGHASLLANTTGQFNTAIGSSALQKNTTGSYNFALGSNASFYNTTGSYNFALGTGALQSNSGGSYNVAIGSEALFANKGSNSVALGYQAGKHYDIGVGENQAASSSLYLGSMTRAAADGNENEIVIGNHALGNGSNSVTLGNDSITKTILKGNVGVGINAPNAGLHVQMRSFLVTASGAMANQGITYTGSGGRMFFDANKMALRAGLAEGTSWDDVNVGHQSVAFGQGTLATAGNSAAFGMWSEASGYSSTAFGESSKAENENSLAGGRYSVASGYASIALGNYNKASGYAAAAFGSDTLAAGDFSASFGYKTTASSSYSLALGRYNVGGGDLSSWVPTDSIFEIGIGSSNASRANALTVLKNGNMGIGTTTPTAQLHTTGTVRLANFGAGTLQTDSSGNVSVSSDLRLKNLVTDSELYPDREYPEGHYIDGLAAIRGLEPIVYQWKPESGLNQTDINIGFSAQNVMRFIPEAVGEDPRGFLTLSDRPILAALVNATKEQQVVLDVLLGIGTSTATSTAGLLGEVHEESLWSKMVSVFSDFKEGVFGLLRAKTVETEELCLDGLCINKEKLQQLLDNNNGNGGQSSSGGTATNGGGLTSPSGTENPPVGGTGTTTPDSPPTDPSDAGGGSTSQDGDGGGSEPEDLPVEDPETALEND